MIETLLEIVWRFMLVAWWINAIPAFFAGMWLISGFEGKAASELSWCLASVGFLAAPFIIGVIFWILTGEVLA